VLVGSGHFTIIQRHEGEPAFFFGAMIWPTSLHFVDESGMPEDSIVSFRGAENNTAKTLND
jgi:hypothetical protein